jgi:hypothetical protein
MRLAMKLLVFRELRACQPKSPLLVEGMLAWSPPELALSTIPAGTSPPPTFCLFTLPCPRLCLSLRRGLWSTVVLRLQKVSTCARSLGRSLIKIRLITPLNHQAPTRKITKPKTATPKGSGSSGANCLPSAPACENKVERPIV